jgi:hypothetical protein
MPKFQRGQPNPGVKFKPGRSAILAGGRPKIAQEVKELAGQHTTEAIETLVKIMRDASAQPSARIMAANALLDRAVRKPTQTVDTTVRHVDPRCRTSRPSPTRSAALNGRTRERPKRASDGRLQIVAGVLSGHKKEGNGAAYSSMDRVRRTPRAAPKCALLGRYNHRSCQLLLDAHGRHFLRRLIARLSIACGS